MENDNLSLVVTRDGKFDFLGINVHRDNVGIILSQAVTVSYVMDGSDYFLTLGQTPMGSINYREKTTTFIPADNIGYILEFENTPEKHPMAERYENFFKDDSKAVQSLT